VSSGQGRPFFDDFDTCGCWVAGGVRWKGSVSVIAEDIAETKPDLISPSSRGKPSLLPPRLCSKDRVNFVVVDNEPLFFQQRDGAYIPTIRLLHKCAPLPLASGKEGVLCR
jgi:hypothetical protein